METIYKKRTSRRLPYKNEIEIIGKDLQKHVTTVGPQPSDVAERTTRQLAQGPVASPRAEEDTPSSSSPMVG